MNKLSESLRTYDSRLKELILLSEGWLDGDGLSVQPAAAKVADMLRVVLENTDTEAPYLYPTPEGGLQAEWFVSEKKLEVTLSIVPDGSVLLVWIAPGQEKEEHLAADAVTMETLAALIRKRTTCLT